MRARALLTFITMLIAVCGFAVPASAARSKPATGGAGYGDPPNPSLRLTVPGVAAQLGRDGFARAPALAPPAVKEAIWAANEIVGKPYVYGGGHNRSFRSRGYDCSGTVSYALRGGKMLKRPRDSSSFLRFGRRGTGDWITIYTNPGHAFVVIAGLRLDTSAANDPSRAKGPRWRPALRRTSGFKRRHPVGF